MPYCGVLHGQVSYINSVLQTLSMDANNNALAYRNQSATQCSRDKYTPYKPVGQLRLELKLQQVFILTNEQL